jgi:PAS domain S-box-containing protein
MVWCIDRCVTQSVRSFHNRRRRSSDQGTSIDGQPARAIAARDVKSRRQAEEQRSRMAAIVDPSTEAIVGSTEYGIVTDWNEGAERMYGYSAREMVGSHISLVVPPEHCQEFVDFRDRLERNERIQNFETVRQRKDGTRFEISLSVASVRDGLGRIIGSATVGHDITSENAPKRRCKSEARYRRLVELSPQAILVHGGSIHVHSVRGQGTTFRLTFALHEDVEAPLDNPKPAMAPCLVEPLRVLAVDDEPAMTKAVVRMLRPAGHLVSVASSGEEALERMATETFDESSRIWAWARV